MWCGESSLRGLELNELKRECSILFRTLNLNCKSLEFSSLCSDALRVHSEVYILLLVQFHLPPLTSRSSIAGYSTT